MNAENRLKELGIVLPVPAKPVAAYVPAVRTGNLLYISGQLPMVAGKLIATGQVPSAVPIDQAILAARQCAINVLAAVKAEVGDLSLVRKVVRLGVFVACDVAFTDQPRVANGASELMLAIFGFPGKHTRAAVGTHVLPLGATVEVDAIFEVEASTLTTAESFEQPG